MITLKIILRIDNEEEDETDFPDLKKMMEWTCVPREGEILNIGNGIAIVESVMHVFDDGYVQVAAKVPGHPDYRNFAKQTGWEKC